MSGPTVQGVTDWFEVGGVHRLRIGSLLLNVFHRGGGHWSFFLGTAPVHGQRFGSFRGSLEAAKRAAPAALISFLRDELAHMEPALQEARANGLEYDDPTVSVVTVRFNLKPLGLGTADG